MRLRAPRALRRAVDGSGIDSSVKLSTVIGRVVEALTGPSKVNPTPAIVERAALIVAGPEGSKDTPSIK